MISVLWTVAYAFACAVLGYWLGRAERSQEAAAAEREAALAALSEYELPKAVARHGRMHCPLCFSLLLATESERCQRGARVAGCMVDTDHAHARCTYCEGECLL